MTLSVFNFPYHQYAVKYPQSSQTIQLNGNWTYVAQPVAPDQRQFVLTFGAMRWFVNPTTGLVDRLYNYGENIAALEDLYKSVRLFGNFIYPHPIEGNLVVKFAKPLEIPNGEPGGSGVVKGISVILTEQPGLLAS